MILSRSAEYALRVMAFIGLHAGDARGGVPLRAKDMEQEVKVPGFYLSKILRRLVSSGLLHGTKGHGGGFVLARPASEVRFIDVLEAIEGVSAPPSCVFGLDACDNANPCVLHHRWKELRGSFLAWATKNTLAAVQSDLRKLRHPLMKKILPPERAKRLAKKLK